MLRLRCPESSSTTAPSGDAPLADVLGSLLEGALTYDTHVPAETIERLSQALSALPDVERADVAGPGFVNLWLAPEWFAAALDEILARGSEYGAGSASQRERIQVEMVSANPTGPLTVAHARNGAYGDSVARLLEFAGHEVSREYYYNDAGTQMELFRASVEARRRGEQPPEEGYQGEYLDELARLPG